MRPVCFALPLLLLATSWTLADPALEKVDRIVIQQLEMLHIPGISVGIVRDGKVLLAKGYGLANVELPRLRQPTLSTGFCRSPSNSPPPRS
jgi:CubicO group peptidase (beta-lactamase class C family)